MFQPLPYSAIVKEFEVEQIQLINLNNKSKEFYKSNLLILTYLLIQLKQNSHPQHAWDSAKGNKFGGLDKLN